MSQLPPEALAAVDRVIDSLIKRLHEIRALPGDSKVYAWVLATRALAEVWTPRIGAPAPRDPNSTTAPASKS